MFKVPLYEMFQRSKRKSFSDRAISWITHPGFGHVYLIISFFTEESWSIQQLFFILSVKFHRKSNPFHTWQLFKYSETAALSPFKFLLFQKSTILKAGFQIPHHVGYLPLDMKPELSATFQFVLASKMSDGTINFLVWDTTFIDIA